MRTIDIDSLKRYIEYLAAKDISGGYLPPDEFNNAINVVIQKVVRKYYGIPEEYQPGMPEPRIGYEISQLVTDYMSQLKVADKYLSVDGSGKALRPEDYLHSSSLAVSFDYIDSSEVSEDEKEADDCCEDTPTIQATKAEIDAKNRRKLAKFSWQVCTVVPEKNRWAWLQSSLRKPTKQFPIATFMGDDIIQFYPEDVSGALFTYLRYPKTAKWAYNIVDGIPVYDAAGSTNVELPEVCVDEMAVTYLDRMGISIREAQLSDWSRYIKESGK